MSDGTPNLDDLGQQLARLDHMLVGLLAQRTKLARQVEKAKRPTKANILRPDVEEHRLRQAEQWAADAGVNRNFVRSIFYQIISESCRVQIEQLQQSADPRAAMDDELDYDTLKKNLIHLTNTIAPIYDSRYDGAHPATRMYAGFERDRLDAEIARLDNSDLAVDLGCATGNMTFRLAPKFGRVAGYDISPAMIQHAKNKLTSDTRNVSFEVLDIETGVPLPDRSASLVVMNLGTASDMRNIGDVVAEIKRILMPGGRFLLSFYNAGALIYSWNVLPWPIPLAAQINPTRRSLDVHCEGDVLSVYARPYTIAEITGMWPGGLSLEATDTYPTIGSVMPGEVLGLPDVRQSVTEIDKQLRTASFGAYIVATGSKAA
jgi:SAM-dependent methyltransferase/chorismate mutase